MVTAIVTNHISFQFPYNSFIHSSIFILFKFEFDFILEYIFIREVFLVSASIFHNGTSLDDIFLKNGIISK